MTSKNCIVLLLICGLLLISLAVSTQVMADQRKFKAEILLGSNFSQLDGDGLSGFNKIGWRTGPRIHYAFANNKGLTFSMLYEQKGSASGIFGVSGLTRRLSLDYFSFPLGIYFGSWWDEYYSDYRIRVLLSVIPGRLIHVSSTNPDFAMNRDQYLNWDASLAIGVAYALGRRVSVDLRLERSLLQLYLPAGQDSRALQSYLVSVQLAYKLYKPGS